MVLKNIGLRQTVIADGEVLRDILFTANYTLNKITPIFNFLFPKHSYEYDVVFSVQYTVLSHKRFRLSIKIHREAHNTKYDPRHFNSCQSAEDIIRHYYFIDLSPIALRGTPQNFHY